jgi:hypothetical protein
MAIRVFRDPEGCEWQVWDVVPSRELESGSRRHHYLPPEMAQGWLCFEAGDQKRRLTPFPVDWEERGDDVLHLLCCSAEPVAPRASRSAAIDARRDLVGSDAPGR